jgi:hypothetical protein
LGVFSKNKFARIALNPKETFDLKCLRSKMLSRCQSANLDQTKYVENASLSCVNTQ